MRERTFMPRIRNQVLLFVMSYIFAFSLAMLATEVFRLPVTAGQNLLGTFVTLFILTVLFFNPTTTIVTFIVAGLGGLLLLLTPLRENEWVTERLEPLGERLTLALAQGQRFLEEGFSYFNSFSTSLTEREQDAFKLLASLILLITTILTFLMIQKLRTYWIPLFLVILLIPLAIYSGSNFALVWLIPLALVSIAMILLSSGHLLDLLRKKNGIKHLLAAGGQMGVAVILALVVAFLATGFLNYQKIYSPYWQGVVDDLVTLLPESFQAPLSISPFSIGDDGYYPLTNRLGGPVVLEDNEVASVVGNVPGLLKVQSSDFYDGQRWQRLVNNPNFRYSSPFNGGAETLVFNPLEPPEFFDLLDGASAEDVYNNYDYTLTPLRQGSQLLFLNGTPTNLVSSREEAMLFYFNQAGAVYARTVFDNQHAYSVESYDINPNRLGFAATPGSVSLSELDRAAAEFQAAGLTLPNHDNAYDNYLQVPGTSAYQPGGVVYETALELTDGLPGNYAKAKSLLSYFTENPEFSYTLEPTVPPADTDFVAYFLNTKIGYCTYYATGLTMLARLSGIPARYVEGYALTSENYEELSLGEESMLNSENAHAWTEVYLDGLGWVPLDPTPGGVLGEGFEEPEPTPPVEPTTTPTTTEEPTTTTEEPTTSTSEDEFEPTTSPTTIEPTTAAKEDRPPSEILRILGRILLVLLLLALLVFLAWFYYKKRVEHFQNIHNRTWLEAKIPDGKKLANFYWKELLSIQRLSSEYLPGTSLTEHEIADTLDAAQQESPVEPEVVEPAPETDPTEDPEAIYRPEHQPPVKPESAAPESSTDLGFWTPLAGIVAEARYRGQDMPIERLAPLADAFDRAETDLRKELGEAGYIRKRLLPPTQGKI